MISIRACTPDDTEAITRLNCEQMVYVFPVEAMRRKFKVLCKTDMICVSLLSFAGLSSAMFIRMIMSLFMRPL